MNKIFKKRILVLLSIFFLINIQVSAQTKTQLPCVDKKFSIVAHIVLDSLGMPGVSNASILTDIDSLNLAFKPICVSFEVCEFDSIENFSYNRFNEDSVWDEMRVIYNKENRINMYFVSQMINPSNENGFSTLNGITQLNNSAILVRKTGNMLPLIAHEMGHFFGLSNTFGGTIAELANGSNCSTAGDRLCDTPADPYSLSSPVRNYVNSSCRFISRIRDSRGEYYIPHVANFMSNYADCACEFSRQQLQIMANTYNGGKGMW